MNGKFRGAAVAGLTLLALGLSACNGGTAGPPAQVNQQAAASSPQSHAARRAYTPACPCEYVADIKGNAVFPGTVIIYPIAANGNYNPGSNVIVGSNTGLLNPAGIALDSASNIYVTNQGNSSVTVYPAGSSGNVTPIATISGTNTGLLNPFGIALDSSDRIYVANGLNTTTPSVTVYAPGSNGNVAPIATIAGPNTGLADPSGIALDPTGRIYVGNENSPSFNGIVTVYAAGANGNAAPIRTIAGPSTGFANGVYGVAWRNNRIFVTSGNSTISSQIGIFPQNSNGNVAPTRSIVGSITQLNSPVGIAVGPTNNRIYVANVRGPSVSTFVAYSSLAPGANNIAPVKLISGSNTQLDAPYGITVR
ncbi:MAG: hypothetical protein WB609_14305 [Candidatus Cybelea sp.]